MFLLKVIIFIDGEWAAGTPGKLTCWISKVVVWKMSFLFNWLIFRLHIGFRGVFRWKYPSWPLLIASWSWRKRKTISFSDPITGWWFQPNWKTLVKLDHFPSRGENIFKKWNHQLESIKTISTKITVDSHVNQFKSSPVSRYIFQTTLKCLPIPNDFCWRWNPRIAILGIILWEKIINKFDTPHKNGKVEWFSHKNANEKHHRNMIVWFPLVIAVISGKPRLRKFGPWSDLPLFPESLATWIRITMVNQDPQLLLLHYLTVLGNQACGGGCGGTFSPPGFDLYDTCFLGIGNFQPKKHPSTLPLASWVGGVPSKAHPGKMHARPEVDNSFHGDSWVP